MNLKQFEYVLTVNKEGCFSKAAEVLNISQPSLSQYIKKLENELGVILFDRSGGNVRLTDAGRVYVDAGKKILDIKHNMALQFMDISENKIGTLIIGTSPYRSAVMMPEVVKEFKKNYSGITLIIEERNTDELLESLEHGESDVVFTVYEEKINEFNYETVGEEEILLAVPSFYENLTSECREDKKYPTIDITALHNFGFVSIKDTQYMQRALKSVGEEYDFNIKTNVVVNSLEAQISMVRKGVGIALVPSGIEALCAKDEVDFYGDIL